MRQASGATSAANACRSARDRAVKRPEIVELDAVIDDIYASIRRQRVVSRSHVSAAARERGFDPARVLARMRRRGLWQPWTDVRPLPASERALDGYRESTVGRRIVVPSKGGPMAALLVIQALLTFVAFGLVLYQSRTDWPLMLAATVLMALPALHTATRLSDRARRKEKFGLTPTKLTTSDLEIALNDIAYFTCADQLSPLARRAMPAAREWLAGYARSVMWCVLAVTKEGEPILVSSDMDRTSARAAVLALEAEVFPERTTKVRVPEEAESHHVAEPEREAEALSD